MVINRGRTAINRTTLSKPYKYIIKNGLIDKASTVLDYGCGKGFDVLELNRNGYNIYGYDKFHEQWGSMTYKHYDIITCNYVMNVIEEPLERIKILARLKCMGDTIIISLRADMKAIGTTWQPYNDGYVTKVGTFQKIYTLGSALKEFDYDSSYKCHVLINDDSTIMLRFTPKK